MIEQLIRENIKNLIPYTSARDTFKSGILLDANENSFGSVIQSDLSLNRYPDPHQSRLRDKMSSLLNVGKNNLFFGVGSDEILDLLIRIFCCPGKDNTLICDPTYGMYKVLCEINGIDSVSVPLNSFFQPDAEEIKKRVTKGTKIMFLCSPNNPTANLINPQIILELCRDLNIVVVVDEAYIEFSKGNSLVNEVKNYENLVILRTLSKAWGLAGIRAGYCIAHETVISMLFKIKAPYSINKMTEQLILEALNNRPAMEKLRDEILAEKKNLITELNTIKNIFIYPSDTNFILVKVSDANHIYNELIKRNVIIRNRSNLPLLENSLRITIGTREENNLLIKNLRELL